MNYACSNGTSFTNLNPMGFASCNSTTTTLQPNTQLTTTSVPPTTTSAGPISGCPPSTTTFNSPCMCSASQPYMNSTTELYINCMSSQNVTDSQLSNFLNAFLSPQIISPVVSIMASFNQLTQVPSQISKFKSLTQLDLSYNQITNISSLSGLSFSSSANINIMLRNNKITNIPSGTFNCTSASYLMIDLSYNNITALPTKAFTYPQTATVMMNMLNLYGNQISTIAPGAFQGIVYRLTHPTEANFIVDLFKLQHMIDCIKQ